MIVITNKRKAGKRPRVTDVVSTVRPTDPTNAGRWRVSPGDTPTGNRIAWLVPSCDAQ